MKRTLRSNTKCFALLARLVLVLIVVTPAVHSGDGSPEAVHPRDLRAWRSPTGDWTAAQEVALDPTDPGRFVTTSGEGILVNGAQGRTVDLITQSEFGDVEVHVEFCISENSNSGVYLMGRYEVQVYDSHGVAKDKYPGIECGGVYPRWTEAKGEFEGHSPLVNASKPAGEWQTFDITFRAPRFDATGQKTEPARFVKVLHNGRLVQENVIVNGPTRAAHWEDEAAAGPLLIQGDHGPVAIRSVVIKPPTLDAE